MHHRVPAPRIKAYRTAAGLGAISDMGRVTRAWPVQTATRNCTRDEGEPFGCGNRVLPLQTAATRSRGGQRCSQVWAGSADGKVERGERLSRSLAQRHAALNGVCERLVDDTSVHIGRQVVMQVRTKSFFFVHRHTVDQFALRSYRQSIRIPFLAGYYTRVR